MKKILVADDKREVVELVTATLGEKATRLFVPLMAGKL